MALCTRSAARGRCGRDGHGLRKPLGSSKGGCARRRPGRGAAKQATKKEPKLLFFRMTPSEGPCENPGAGNESRTRDLNLGKVALYQLSYSRVCLRMCCEDSHYSLFQVGGASRNRTDVHGFAIRCITTLPLRRTQRRPSPSQQKGEAWASPLRGKSGAGNESRTRDLNLGKVALYQLSYSRIVPARSHACKSRAILHESATPVNWPSPRGQHAAVSGRALRFK